ncbi:MAG: hypothetical protein ACRCY9_20245 [Phycicoccus sp.]
MPGKRVPSAADHTSHPAFGWVGEPALALDVYQRLFDGAEPEISGESPYLSAPAAGVSFALYDDHTVRAVFLYARGVEGFGQFDEALPAGLSFEATREHVRATLDSPAMGGDASGIGVMAIKFPFDRFESGDRYLRFEFRSATGPIRLVTIGSTLD